MTDYAILKQEYEVKRIFAGEAEAIAQTMVKYEFPRDVEEWVWTGSTGALLKFNAPNIMGTEPFPQAQANLQAGGYPDDVAHTSGGGYMGLQPVQHHIQHGPTGTTASGSQAALARQARAGREYDFDAGQWQGDATPQQEMYENQFGTLQPGAGSRFKNAMGRFGRWAGQKGRQGLEAAKTGAGWAAGQAQRGGAAALRAGQTAVRHAGNVAGGAWDAANTAVTEGQKEIGNPFKRVKESLGRIGGEAGKAFTARMDEGQGHTARIRQPSGEATREQFPMTMDDSAMASNANALGRRAELTGSPSPVPLSDTATTSPTPTATTSPTPTAAPMPGGPTAAPMPEATPPQTQEVEGTPGTVGVQQGQLQDVEGTKSHDKLFAGTPEQGSAPSEWSDADWDQLNQINQTVGDMRAGKPFDRGAHHQPGFAVGSYGRIADKIKQIGDGGGEEAAPAATEAAPATTDPQAAREAFEAAGGASKGPTGSAYYNPDGTRKVASFDAHQIAWDALLKGL